MCRSLAIGKRKGFTLVELAVVIVIIGVLAAFGVPQFLKSVERSKAAEAFNYMSAIRASQERYLAKNGFYYSGTADESTGAFSANEDTTETLDITQTIPKYFTVGAITEEHATAGAPTWTCTLTRKESSYGNYTVTFTEAGYDASTTAPAIGAYSDINPMGSDVVAASSS
jgi:prepilin-type N-terminal cleavage/methylation domain-containing protein